MNEQYWSEQFSRDLESGPDPDRGRARIAPPEYERTVALARQMAVLDLSTDSEQQAALRRDLMERIEGRDSRRKKVNWSNRLNGRGRTALTVLRGLIALLLVVIVFSPGARIAAAQGIGHILERISLGLHTVVAQINPTTVAERVARAYAARNVIVTDIGRFAGDPYPGTDPTIRTVATRDEAQALTPFDIRVLTDLPEGYALREVTVGGGRAVLSYGGPGHDIVLLQALVGPGFQVGWVTDGPVEVLDLDGREAAWVNGRVLTWEEGSTHYSLGGLDLTLEEAIRIARSLE